jgi:hypothetical protein
MTANTRLKIGIAFAVGGNLLFFTSAWIAWMPWSASFKATLWGILFFAPEVGTLIGAALMGKENYERFKEAAFKFIGHIKPSGGVGKMRYHIGLVMFCVPLLPTYVQAFKPEWLPDNSPLRWQVKIAADLIFVASLFVLGGDFWDKLHALFTWDARAMTTEKRATPANLETTESQAGEPKVGVGGQV